jgi:Na+-driven multidrug efflux pump
MARQRIYQDDTSSTSSSTVSESSPLLTKRIHDTDHTTVRQEFKWLLLNSLPIIGTYLLQASFQLASIFTLGHLVGIYPSISSMTVTYINNRRAQWN